MISTFVTLMNSTEKYTVSATLLIDKVPVKGIITVFRNKKVKSILLFCNPFKVQGKHNAICNSL